jgi:anaerobic selenocysteine-containing dehydrogenase
MNGQPTAENTRECGADGDLAGFRNWQNEAPVEELARLWNVDPLTIPHWGPPTHAMQIWRYAEQGSIKLLWIICTNPAVSLPELHRIRSILAHERLFVVVQDAFLTDAKLRGGSGIQWPCTDQAPEGTERLYADGRTVYHFHTRTKTGRAPQLTAAAPDVWVELAAVDAEELGIAEGDLVRVESPRGRLEARARLGRTRPGVVFAPFHYGYWDQPDGDRPDGRARAANELTITEWDPVSKQPLYKVAAVRVTKLAGKEG